MTKFTFGLAAVLVAVLLLAAGAAGAAEHEIRMLSVLERPGASPEMMVFDPPYLYAEPGDTVRFIPGDPGHNTASSLVPEGAESWSSAFGEEVVLQLREEGVYLYACTPHVIMGMVGVVQVGEATNRAAAEAKASELSAQIAMNGERLAAYLEQVR